ncbi:MAG TPA: PQQ-binding-like beta-propeller repeat protein [Baekduia sp.]
MARTRRGWRVVGATLLAALALTAGTGAPPAHAAAGDATNELIDAQHSSSQPVGGPSGTLRPAWTLDASGMLSTVLVVDGRVFATDGNSVFAVDASTGRRLWTRRMNRIGGIVFSHGHVVIGACGSDALVAVDPASGDTAWLRTTARSDVCHQLVADDDHIAAMGEFNRSLTVFDSATGAMRWTDNDVNDYPLPAIEGDELIVAPRGGFAPVPSEAESTVYAYDLDTGARRAVASGQTNSAHLTSIHDDLVYINNLLAVTPSGSVKAGAAFDPATGGRVGGDYHATTYPAEDAQGLYLLDGTTLSAVAGPGQPARWTFTRNGLAEAPLAAGGRVWTISGGDDNRVFGLDPATGAVAQSLQLPADGFPSGPLAAGDGLLLVPYDTHLVAFAGDEPVRGSATGPVGPLPAPTLPADRGVTGDRQDAGRTGLAPGAPAPPLSPRWRTRTGRPMGTPLIVDGVAIVADRRVGPDDETSNDDAGQAMLTAYDLGDGAVRWRRPLDGAGFDTWELAADDGHVYADDGTRVQAFAIADGRALWQRDVADSRDQLSHPVAIGGLVYLGASALDGATGDRVWSRQVPYATVAYPAVDEERLYVVEGYDAACKVTALDRRTGATVWTTPRECVRWDGVSVSGGRVAFDGAVFDAATGAVIDTAHGTLDGALAPDLSVERDQHDECNCWRYVPVLSARRPDGPDAWQVEGATSPLLTGPFVYAAIAERLTALRTADGTVAWQAPPIPGGGSPYADDAPTLAASSGVLLEERGDELTAWEHADDGAPVVDVTAPVSPTRSAESTVSFAAPPGATTTCAVDDAAATACASPWTTPDLDEGRHALHVRATLDGVTGPVATALVEVDTTPPRTRVLTPVPSYVDRQVLGIETDESAWFVCSFDGAAEQVCANETDDLGSSMPFDEEGPHTLAIHAVDAAGNVEDPGTTLHWTTDHTPPDVTLTLATDRVRDDTIRPEVTVSEPGSPLQCRVDGGDWLTCPDPVSATVTTDGFHTLDVRAIDRTGTLGYPDSVTWQRDTTGPRPDIPALWVQPHGPDVSVFIWGYDRADRSWGPIRCRLDDEPWEPCTGSAWERDDVAPGHHVFQYEAWDDLGNDGGVIRRGFDVYATWWPTWISGAYEGAPTLHPPDADWPRNDCTVDGVTRPCPPGERIDVSDAAPGWHWLVATSRDEQRGAVACSRTWWWKVALPDGTVPGPAPAAAAGGGWATGPGDPGPEDELHPGEPGTGSGAPACGSYMSAPGTPPWPDRSGTLEGDEPGAVADPVVEPTAPLDAPPATPTLGAATGTPADEPVVDTTPAGPGPATPTPTTAASAPPPAARTPLAVALDAATVRRAGASALRVTLRAPANGRLRLRLSHGAAPLGTRTVAIRRARTAQVTIRLGATGRRFLARRGTATVTLDARIGSTAARRAITLRR